MKFDEIYRLVNEKAELDLNELLKECNAEIVRDNDMMHGFEARSMMIDDVFLIFLKEDMFEVRERCLYLIGNHIWEACYFQQFLMCNGADRHIANKINDEIYHYKLNVQQQIGWHVMELL